MKHENSIALCAFEKYADLILRTAYCCIGNYSEAEDITQEVFLTLHEKPQEFQNDEHMKAWLLRVAINKGKNYRTSWKQKGRTSLEDRPEISVTDSTAEKNELREAVLALPEKYATVLFLHYYAGYTIKEMAAILKKRENTVSSLLRRGREKLKIEMEAQV